MGPRCLHPKALYEDTSLVDGLVTQHRWTCDSFRAADTRCGPDGKYWEPKDDTSIGFVDYTPKD